MEFLFGFLAGLLALNPFWLMVIAIFVLVEILAIHDDEPVWCSLSLVALVATIFTFNWFGGNPFLSPLAFCWEHIYAILIGFPLYFVAGGLWSLFKWYQKLLKVRDEFQEKLAVWERCERPGSTRPARPTDSYARNNKGRITGWITYWPFSVLDYIFGDFLAEVARSIYRALSKVYENMGNRVFKDLE